MDALLKAIKELKISGTPEEERDFEYFKNRAIEQLREDERRVLAELHKHSPPSITHSIMVAHDVEYIAKRLGFPDDKVRALVISALLHDVGKVDIHNAILNNVSKQELEAAWKESFPGRPLPKGDLRDAVTLRQVVEHKAGKSSDHREYVRLFEKWMKDKGLSRFIELPFYEYIKHHPGASRDILSRIGVSPDIIDYVAGHHPEYFSEAARNKLPKECHIIDVADKFNAIIQSEGVRAYISKESRTRALNIIAHELRQDMGAFHAFEKLALRILVERYLPPEVMGEVIPTVKRLIMHMKIHLLRMRRYAGEKYEDSDVKEARKLMALITATLALSNEFGHVLDHSTESSLEYYEKELEDVLKAA
ncbi:HD domain-containing protein [archaeon]|nr:HD domain-containing protein [archaeon]